jgi:hypothetical protein
MAASDQVLRGAEVVPDVRAGDHPGQVAVRVVVVEQAGEDLAKRVHVGARPQQRDLCTRVVEDAGGDRMPLPGVGVEQRVGRVSPRHQRELPAPG